MNPISSSGRPNPLRRWFLSLLTTHPARRLLHHTLLATLALQLSAPSWAGSDFQVNTYTTDNQWTPAVAMDSNGDFVIVWASMGSYGTDIGSYSIQGQRYNSAGTAQGGQFQVNTYTTSNQRYPTIAMDSDGDFVVVWESDGSSGSDASSRSIHGQRYNAAGVPQGGEFQVNTYTTDYQGNPAVALDSDGDFVVVWQSLGSSGSDTSSQSTQGQRYNSMGTPQGGQFQVNTYTTNLQLDPDVALDANGDFVVIWSSLGSNYGDTSDWSIQGQRYSSTGALQGTQFQVNSYTTSQQHQPAVAMDSTGNFVVTWSSNGSNYGDTDWSSVQGQRYNSAGTPQGSQFQINSYTTHNQRFPAVSLDSDGDFIVVWDNEFSNYGGINTRSIQGKRYNSAGMPQSGQFQANTYVDSDQNQPVVALDNDGDFVVTWNSYGLANLPVPPQPDTDYAITARRFSLQPTDVSLVNLQPAAPSFPMIATFLALLTALATLLTTLYRRLRR